MMTQKRATLVNNLLKKQQHHVHATKPGQIKQSNLSNLLFPCFMPFMLSVAGTKSKAKGELLSPFFVA